MKNSPSLSNWRSVRAYRQSLAFELEQRHTLRWHSFWIGLLTLLSMWATSFALRLAWSEGLLGIRYALVLAVGYGACLLLIRLWAGYLSGKERVDSGLGDVIGEVLPDIPGNIRVPEAGVQLPKMSSGGGGDFTGGGAQASFDSGSALGHSSNQLVSGAFEAAGAADEGAVVVVPVLAVFAMLVLALTGASLMFSMLFGIDVLLAVTVEVALALTAGRTAYKVAAEDWLQTAVQLTWKPMLGVVVSAMALGFLIDYYVPHAQSASQAIRFMSW
ncbi:MAG: hypothetical protein ACKO1L_05610 [Brachymonas sp.]